MNPWSHRCSASYDVHLWNIVGSIEYLPECADFANRRPLANAEAELRVLVVGARHVLFIFYFILFSLIRARSNLGVLFFWYCSSGFPDDPTIEILLASSRPSPSHLSFSTSWVICRSVKFGRLLISFAANISMFASTLLFRLDYDKPWLGWIRSTPPQCSDATVSLSWLDYIVFSDEVCFRQNIWHDDCSLSAAHEKVGGQTHRLFINQRKQWRE